MRVLRIYHAGRDPGHRLRDRALVAAGVDVTLLVPSGWPDAVAQQALTEEQFPVVELAVGRPGDVNRHRYLDLVAVRNLIARVRPDVIDLHEEPVSVVTRQLLSIIDRKLLVVGYTAQNVDKRFPPPFAQYERMALSRLQAIYPCSKQAASVVRGKGFGGLLDVIPLGYDQRSYWPGRQGIDDPVLTLGFVGRLVPEKGVLDAIEVLAAVGRRRPARLLVVGSGPEVSSARELAARLGVAAALEILPWCSQEELAQRYREMHVLLVPSRSTETWVEQFGRVIIEGQAAGAVVVGYASGAIPEVAGVAATLAAEGDTTALALATLALLTDPVRYVSQRERGLVAAPSYSWSEVARRQAALYEAVMTTVPAHCVRARPIPARSAAVAEYGAPARVAGQQQRPFALPILRRDNVASRALGRMVDAASWASRRLSYARSGGTSRDRCSRR